MKEIEELYSYEEEYIPDGHDMTSIPKATSKNMEKVVNKLNEIIVVVNAVGKKFNLFDGEDEACVRKMINYLENKKSS